MCEKQIRFSKKIGIFYVNTANYSARKQQEFGVGTYLKIPILY